MKGKVRLLRAVSFVLSLSICVGTMSPAVYADDVLVPATPSVIAAAEESPIYLDRSYSFEERAADLLSRMTLNQKASQMISGYSSAIPELNMNWYGWWNEALHGVSRLQAQRDSNATTIYNTTSYPISLAMGSTWNPELMYRVATEIGDEAREVTRDNRYELTFYSPTVNLLRDPRWGRADEAFGEDAYHTAMMASQFVNGMEGKDMQGNRLDENGYLKTISTIKHYLGNNSEGNRLKGSSNMTDKELREYYSYVYRLIVEQSDVSSVMAAYNRVNEVPANLNNYVLDTLLRQTFGFDGYVTADCNSVAVSSRGNGYDQDPLNPTSNGHGWRHPDTGAKLNNNETVAWAINAGGDLECNNGHAVSGFKYSLLVPGAAAQGITTPSGVFDENSVDVSLLRLLSARMALGEFDVDAGVVSWYNQARETIENKYGPDWKYNLSSVASNGADTMTDERASLSLEASHEALVLLKNDKVANGDSAKALLPIQVPASGDFKVVIVGANSYVNTTNMFLGGYSANMGSAGQAKLVNPYNGLRSAILKANPNASVNLIGFSANSTAISEEQLNSLADADLVIFYAGTNASDGNEDKDRGSLNLPGAQSQNILKVVEKNPSTVVVMETISTNYIGSFADKVPALVWSSYNGMLKGDALADVLLGEVNFSGRTSSIWFDSNDQMLSTYSYRLSPGEDSWPYPEHSQFNSGGKDTYSFGVGNGRTYMYYDEARGGAVRYPFGYGLSYSNFDYSNLQVGGLSGSSIDANGTLNVSVDVTNTTNVDGAEVVQLYMATPGSPAELLHPIKRLVGFDKVQVPAGQTVTVNMDVKVKDLAFFDEDSSRFEVYNGAYNLQVGKDHKNIVLNKDFTVTGQLTPEISVVTAKAVQSGDKAKDIPNRVRFDLGKTVNPQLTITMSDDTMYGYVMKGQSSSIPERFNISYTSNRPSVVSVTDGVIQTKTSGVATITATVTDSATGSTETCDFVVLVVPGDGPQLSELKINGQSVDNFEPGLRNYTYTVPVGTLPNALSITAAAMEGSEIVSITNVSEIPGEAKVTVTNGDTTMDYIIRFIYNEPQILSVMAKNGILTVQFNMMPDEELTLADFSSTIALDAFEGSILSLSNMQVDRTAKTVTFSYPEVVKLERSQLVHISIAYKHTPAISTSFELEKDFDLLYSIKVDGNPLSGFRYGTKSYTQTAEEGNIPRISASAADKSITINITQASKLWESAKVSFTSGSTTDTYLITFVPESATRFNSLPADWEILNANDKAIFADTGITIPASNLSSGNDFPSTSMLNMLQYNGSLNGDWTVTVKVTNDRTLPGNGYPNYGIALNNTGTGSSNWIKLVQISGGNPSWQYNSGFQSANNFTGFNFTTAWLRLQKEGSNIIGYYSSDGVNFSRANSFDAGTRMDGAKLQLFSTTNQDTSSVFNTTFEYIHMEKDDQPVNSTITFAVTPANAAVVVTNSEGSVVAPTSGNALVYDLAPGQYNYSVSAEGFQTKSATFTADGNKTITVDLSQAPADKYAITFAVTPANAAVEVRNSAGDVVAPTAANALIYDLAPGEYSYTVSAQGYQTKTSSFTVGAQATITVELTADSAPVDKTELETVAEEAEALNQADYTPETWAVLRTALNTAKDVLSDDQADQGAVDSALAALRNAIAQLKEIDPGEIIEVEAIRIEGDETVKRNKTVKLTAVIDPENATIKDVTWVSLNPAIATVDQNGIVKATSKTGFAIIEAKAHNGVSMQFTIRVTA
ncbi:glycoside hydrolase family 3 N-terminal domain-containing protein [Oscillospiraceae bacterium MB08-C2-2]|nr:glycoside hydrolase family 3 N-terminal domain-containing protein [Oscillospiraceae bacterium MB08-C2-2]